MLQFQSPYARPATARRAIVIAASCCGLSATALAAELEFAALHAPVRVIAQPPTADEVVAKVRAALGIELLSGTKAVKLLAKGSYLGAPPEATLVLDATGRFARSVKGPIDMAWTFDAKDVWTRDLGGEVYRAIAGDWRDAIFNAYALSGFFFSPSAHRKYALAPSADAEPPTLLISSDSTPEPIRVEVDPSTWLPRAYRVVEGGSPRDIQITEWREQS
ncbi:MAG: hypothetical protein JNL50_14065, partial [Phycisphaerae bacterium]|nr:hypothetical protein [Phycisphaerae bacterium]